MAERLIDTSMLTAEANAIRGKGISGNIEFKNNGFADAIGSIPTAKNIQYSAKSKRIASSYYAQQTGASVTVAKTGTYNIYWMATAQEAGSSSYNYSTQLYIGNTAYGSLHYATAVTDTTQDAQIEEETDVSLTAGQVVTVRARSRGSSYFTIAGMLVIEEV